MKKIFYGFIISLLLAGAANAAILIKSPSGQYVTATSLSNAATRLDAANKTVVVTSALSSVMSNISSATVHAWPSDRKLTVEKGGSIGNTTKFEFAGGAQYDASWFGTTTARLQKALDACIDSTMTISQDYTLTSGVTVAGDNCNIKFLNGAKLIAGYDGATTQEAMFFISGDNVTVEDEWLDGDSHGLSGLVAGGANNLRLLRGRVEDFVGTNAIGIAIGKLADGTTAVASDTHMIDGVTADGNDFGIYIYSNIGFLVKNTTIQNCVASNNNDKGISFVADGGTLYNNYATGNGVTEIYVAGGATAGQWGDVVINSNRMVSTADVAINSGYRMGIKVSSGTTNFQLINNHIDTTASAQSGSYFGIRLEGASNGVIANNKVYSNLNGAIYVAPHPDANGSNSYDLSIESNTFNSNGTAAVALSKTATGGYTSGRIHFRKNTIEGNYVVGINGGHDDSEYVDNFMIGNIAYATNVMYMSGNKQRISRNFFSGFTRSAILYEMAGTTDYVDTMIVGNKIAESTTPTPGYGRIQIITAMTNASVISGMYIADNLINGGSNGILIGTYNPSTFAITADKSTNITISNNKILNTVRDAIHVFGNYCKILSNTIWNFSKGSGTYNGLSIQGNNNIAKSNVFENTSSSFGGHIVVFSGASSNKIINNYLGNNDRSYGGFNTYTSHNIYGP